MGVETALIGGGLGALGGAVKGAKGTPDQTVTQKTDIAPAGAVEQRLQNESLNQYMQAGEQAKALEAGMGSAGAFQDAARQAGMGVLSGEAMNLTPGEQQQIADLRSALLNQSQYDINTQLDKRLVQAQADAANRGLRGQAMGGLQGQVLQGGAEALGRATMDVNRIAAQAAMENPYRRIQAQQGMIGMGMSLADQLRQQAVQNRMALQDPALMRYLSQERIAGATTTQHTPGQRGGFWGAVGGGLGGAGAGFNLGTNVSNDLNSLNVPSGFSTGASRGAASVGSQAQNQNLGRDFLLNMNPGEYT
jgi:hypothetical protein